jgi:hypothetical protein
MKTSQNERKALMDRDQFVVIYIVKSSRNGAELKSFECCLMNWDDVRFTDMNNTRSGENYFADQWKYDRISNWLVRCRSEAEKSVTQEMNMELDCGKRNYVNEVRSEQNMLEPEYRSLRFKLHYNPFLVKPEVNVINQGQEVYLLNLSTKCRSES